MYFPLLFKNYIISIKLELKYFLKDWLNFETKIEILKIVKKNGFINS